MHTSSIMYNNTILAIDTGTEKTGYCIIEQDTYRPLQFGKVENDEILNVIDEFDGQTVVFERFAPQQRTGMTTVTAIVWYGRFIERCTRCGYSLNEGIVEIYRRDVKKHLLGKFDRSKGSADSQLRKYLVQRFAKFDMKNGKGTKDSPDWFYGFSTTDVYAAYCVGVAYLDGLCNDKKGTI